MLFQSRSGFSVFCDAWAWAVGRSARSVSIPFWVFCVLRLDRARLEVLFLCVSIPFWVFCVLRPQGPQHCTRHYADVSIPFWVFCVLRLKVVHRRVQQARGFNPVLGFLCSATIAMSRPPELFNRFQSRSGFSVFCDLRVGRTSRGPARGFNPVLGFLCSATRAPTDDEGHPIVSIPFWVFCVLRRSSRPPTSASGDCFNPVLGFLCSATRWRDERRYRSRRVSIPFWVFCVLRLPEGDAETTESYVFQSRSGFSVFCDRLLPQSGSSQIEVSIPFWVFCVLRQGVKIRLYRSKSFLRD